MKSKRHGKNTSVEAEVQGIEKDGIWLFVAGEEFFLPYEEYPWFRGATVDEIHNLEVFASGTALHWPDLDVDLEIESLRNPEKYPLKAKG